jgi:hypothetical protein
VTMFVPVGTIRFDSLFLPDFRLRVYHAWLLALLTLFDPDPLTWRAMGIVLLHIVLCGMVGLGIAAVWPRLVRRA